MTQKNMQKSTISSNPSTAEKMGALGLAAIVISSMIGGGIFSLPQNMAASASVGAVILAWLITGIGMYFIANVFRILSMAKPNLTTGIYMYAKEGFACFIGQIAQSIYENTSGDSFFSPFASYVKISYLSFASSIK